MTRTRGPRPLACHHEAGHAVARWWLGFRSDDATVLSLEQVRSGAGIEDREGEEHLDAEGMVNGPPIAFVLGRTQLDGLDGAERDWMERQGVRRVDMALVASAAGVHAEAVYRQRSLLAVFLAGGSADHADAQAIAASWHESVDERHAAVTRADRIARDLMRSYKGLCAVRLVAHALHARGRVEGNEIDALCASAYGTSFAYDRWSKTWPPTAKQIETGFLPIKPERSPT